jgi:hypothetical protein
MKVRHLTVFVLAIGLALLLAWSVAAQGPEPLAHQQRDGSPKPPLKWDGDKPFSHPNTPDESLGAQEISTAAAGLPAWPSAT